MVTLLYHIKYNLYYIRAEDKNSVSYRSVHNIIITFYSTTDIIINGICHATCHDQEYKSTQEQSKKKAGDEIQQQKERNINKPETVCIQIL